MSPTDIEEILAITPFKPMRVTLSSGDKFVVDRQFRMMVDGGVLYVSTGQPDPKTGRRLRLISTVNVAMIERLEGPVPPEAAVRRRRR